MAKSYIYRVAILDKNFHVKFFLPTFFSSEQKAEEAIDRVMNSEGHRGRVNMAWNRHPWQTCFIDGEGSRTVRMIKTAEWHTEIGGEVLAGGYDGYGIITYSMI